VADGTNVEMRTAKERPKEAKIKTDRHSKMRYWSRTTQYPTDEDRCRSMTEEDLLPHTL